MSRKDDLRAKECYKISLISCLAIVRLDPEKISLYVLNPLVLVFRSSGSQLVKRQSGSGSRSGSGREPSN